MKILTAQQTGQLDAFTMEQEPIASIDLMERAAGIFVDWFTHLFDDPQRPVCIFCGIGNNGGDGLVAARQLHQKGYSVTIYWVKISEKTSEDFRINMERLPRWRAVEVLEIHKGDAMPALPEGAILIDAIFGSGLNRPVEGYWAELLEHLNRQPVTRVAIDTPSGVFADQLTEGPSIRADYTLSFQLPKLAFLLPENEARVGKWEVRDIGLNQSFIDQAESTNYYIDASMAGKRIKRRGRFDHKGTYGHALLIVGKYGSIGAAVLASRACLRAGAGLVTTHLPQCGLSILQTAAPEAMASIDQHELEVTTVPPLDPYNAIGGGCGLGQNKMTREAVMDLLQKADQPLVLDADALNIIAQAPGALQQIPEHSILTPHPKEFERLFGPSDNHFHRLELQRRKAQEHQLCILLKGGHTSIADPAGNLYFNSTGNPGMGTAGAGDVLTGFLTGLLAQKYTPLDAAILGVYLHGLAGDLAADSESPEAMTAGDIVEHMGWAWEMSRRGAP